MDLLAGYDSDEEEDEVSNIPDKKLAPLPSANLVLKKPTTSSVFTNSYKSESTNDVALEKHVKMVENKQNISEVNGRKICWMYRQGRCRFGSKCNMFHDSELRDSFVKEKKIDKACRASRKNSAVNETVDEKSNLPTKKRYGVTNTLEPPKKAMKEIKRIQYEDKKSKFKGK